MKDTDHDQQQPPPPTASRANAIARLLANGNLVLRVPGAGVVWQSFDHPTNMLLPGMKLGVDFRTGLDRHMSSWRATGDPSPGEYTFRLGHARGFEITFVNNEFNHRRLLHSRGPAALDRVPRFRFDALGRGNHAGRNDPDDMYLCSAHAISGSVGLILDPDPRRRGRYLVAQLYPRDSRAPAFRSAARRLRDAEGHLPNPPRDVAQRRRIPPGEGQLRYALHDLHDIAIAAPVKCSTDCLGANISLLALTHAVEAVPTSSPTSMAALQKVYFDPAGIFTNSPTTCPGYLASAQLFEDCSWKISTVVLLLSTRVQQTRHIDGKLLDWELSVHVPFFVGCARPGSCVGCIDTGGANSMGCCGCLWKDAWPGSLRRWMAKSLLLHEKTVVEVTHVAMKPWPPPANLHNSIASEPIETGPVNSFVLLRAPVLRLLAVVQVPTTVSGFRTSSSLNFWPIIYSYLVTYIKQWDRDRAAQLGPIMNNCLGSAATSESLILEYSFPPKDQMGRIYLIIDRRTGLLLGVDKWGLIDRLAGARTTMHTIWVKSFGRCLHNYSKLTSTLQAEDCSRQHGS
ncbi:unnamed protein product [Miscanthus lutarioriparius]|uniref:non-specific serine/threonine protein kinase n=1 Tax=Miscanthus lutarioriparius TaxID=422564 RepID=A0A811NIJ4_9POAL|nr:unnamed protein product [Miscanthus lutarioriparius]